MAKIDVVPGRQLPNSMRSSTDVNLYKSTCYKRQYSIRMKSDFENQNLLLNKSEINIDNVRLLKSYLYKKDLSIPSSIIEQCSNDVFENNRNSISPTALFLGSLQKLSKILNQKRYSDCLNRNNNLLEGLPKTKVFTLSRSINNDIKNILLDPVLLNKLI